MDASQLRQRVREAYSEAAASPYSTHAFPVGKAFARSLGYPQSVLDPLPKPAEEAFAGVSNVSVFADLAPGSTILDLGCGSGLDALIAANRVGPGGRLIGIDFSVSMVQRAHCSARQMDLANAQFCVAEAETLPLGDASVDAALVNGIFNLNPRREEIFRELARVIKPGGVLFGAELILRRRYWRTIKVDPDNWFA